MKRDPALIPLSEHHHHALVQSLAARRAEARGADEKAWRALASEFVRFWDHSGRTHFLEEENVLLPAYARHADPNDDLSIRRMLEDHAWIRGTIETLRLDLATGAPVAERVAALGRRLNDHVRLEENEVFPLIEAVLDDADRAGIERSLTRLHAD